MSFNMEQRQIKPVSDRKNKQQSYQNLLGRYSKAMKEGFYFEAILITYSMLEDRLIAFLYYCGFFETRESLKLSKKVKLDIANIIYPEGAPNKWPTFNCISTKVMFLRILLNWANTVIEKDIADNKYLIGLKNQLEGIDIGGMLDSFDKLDNWLAYRNEIVHSLMNKNILSLNDSLKGKVEEGMVIARFIDNQERILKKNGVVRKILKMQNK